MLLLSWTTRPQSKRPKLNHQDIACETQLDFGLSTTWGLNKLNNLILLALTFAQPWLTVPATMWIPKCPNTKFTSQHRLGTGLNLQEYRIYVWFLLPNQVIMLWVQLSLLLYLISCVRSFKLYQKKLPRELVATRQICMLKLNDHCLQNIIDIP